MKSHNSIKNQISLNDIISHNSNRKLSIINTSKNDFKKDFIK